jgi:ATP-dependent Lon protease
MSEIAPASADDPAYQALYREVRERSSELGKRRGIPAGDAAAVPGRRHRARSVLRPGRLLHRDGDGTKQKLLETLAVEERLRTLLVLIERQLALMDAQEDIQQQVQEELGERQREMLLREQLKAIQRELGEDGEGQEVEELREKIAGLGLPEIAPARRWSAS